MRGFSETKSLTIPPDILGSLQRRYRASSADDAETLATIARAYKESGIVVDPHTAVGLAAAARLKAELKGPVVALATAHPAKFSASVTQALGKPAELPLHLSDLLSRKERYTVLPNALAEVKAFVLERARHK
jgi:threonine synthase